MALVDKTIMLTYDLVLTARVDLGLENIRAMYGSGIQDEHFWEWLPKKFVMTFKVTPEKELIATQKAVETAIKALYRRENRPQVRNLQIWLNGQQYITSQQPAQ